MHIPNVEQIINTFQKKRILVVGDVMLDHYSYGKVDRISPEAPVPIIHIVEEKFVPGGAGNVFLNICTFGAKATLVSVTGADDVSRRLKESFGHGSCGEQVFFTDFQRRSTVKHRLVAKGQQLLRVDSEDTFPIPAEVEAEITHYIDSVMSSFDGVCISDYGKGLMSKTLAAHIIALATSKGIPVLVDAKPKNFSFYKHCSLITPNESEVMGGYPHMGCIEAGQSLSQALQAPVLITRGPKGVTYITKEGREAFSLPSYAKEENVRDVSGAGDTVVATLALTLSSGLDATTSAFIASKAAAVAVTKPFTSAVTIEELRAVM